MIRARINEIFDSVQGEGIFLGEKQLFVRFFGCNLSCRYCDTKLNRFLEYEPQELFEEILLYENDFHSISFTGGEPLLQSDFLKELLPLTAANGYTNYLETNGTLAGELKEVINYVDIVAMDIKLPSSAGMLGLWGLHRRFLEVASQKHVFIKIIVCESTHEDDLRETISLIRQVNSSPVVVLQPNSLDEQWPLISKMEHFKKLCTDKGITTCVIPQMHKLIGVK